jgi:purine-nucleoside phosphorylase
MSDDAAAVPAAGQPAAARAAADNPLAADNPPPADHPQPADRPGAVQDPYAAAARSAARLAELTGQARHDAAVILGSGWAPAADALAETLGAAVTEIPVTDLGGFAPPTVAGHAGTVRSMAAADLRLLVFLGRTHLYEGHPVTAAVHGVRTAVAAGCRVVALTNAAGGIRDGFRVGQPVLVRDHLNLTGRSPLTGPPPPEPHPPRFADLTDLYSPRLRRLARDAEPSLAEGVYAALPGPHYETPAEIAMLRVLGADLVGMSTVLEAIAARHLGAEVLAISLVTNLAAGLSGAPLSHQEVIAAGQASAGRMGSLLAAILPRACASAS